MVGLIQLQRVERVGAVDFNAHTCCNAFGGDRMLPHPKNLNYADEKNGIRERSIQGAINDLFQRHIVLDTE